MTSTLSGPPGPGYGSRQGSEQPLYIDFTDPAEFSAARGAWTIVIGTAPTISGGVASPFSGTEVAAVRAQETIADVESVWKITTSASFGPVAAGWSFIARYIDNSNYLLLRMSDNASSIGLELYKKDGGAFTVLASSGYIYPAATSTAYWVRSRVIGNSLTVELWATDPAAGGAPTGTLSYTLAGGDATKFGAGVRGKVGFRHASAKTYTLDDFIIRPLSRPPRQRDVQVFTSSGTWTPPPGALADPLATVRTILVAPGNGGASGCRRAAGTAVSGGAGGAAGGCTDVTMPIAQATAGGTVTVTVPAAGAGGAAVTTDDTNGNNGGIAGGQTIFAGVAGSVKAYRSAVAAGGGSTSASTAGAAAAIVTHPTNPGAGGVVGSAGQSGNWNAGKGPIGGAAGGGIDVGNNWKAGGTTGGFNETESGTAAGGATNGAAGGAGTSGVTNSKLWTGYWAGGGGGGGASGVGVNGGNGGNGGSYGGGGGGGGAAQNGFTSGAGGNGGPGIAIIITEWGG